MDDALTVLLGLIFWYCAVVGFITVGKRLKRWIEVLIGTHPNLLRSGLGGGADGSERPSRLEEALGPGR